VPGVVSGPQSTGSVPPSVWMIWIFAVVTVILLTVIVELLMVYQKRAHDIRMRQEPMRRHIREHLRNMQEATQNIRRTAGQRFAEMKLEADVLRKQSGEATKMISQLEVEIFGEARGEVADVEEALEAVGEEEEEGEKDEEEEKRELVREAGQIRDEVDLHLASVRRDLEIVRRTLERIEAKMTRRMAGGKKKEGPS
jgi:hypothetical protein